MSHTQTVDSYFIMSAIGIFTTITLCLLSHIMNFLKEMLKFIFNIRDFAPKVKEFVFDFNQEIENKNILLRGHSVELSED